MNEYDLCEPEEDRRALETKRTGKYQDGENRHKQESVEERRKLAIERFKGRSANNRYRQKEAAARFKAQLRYRDKLENVIDWEMVLKKIEVGVGTFLFLLIWASLTFLIAIFTSVGYGLLIGLFFSIFIFIPIVLVWIVIKWLFRANYRVLDELTPPGQQKYRGD